MVFKLLIDPEVLAEPSSTSKEKLRNRDFACRYFNYLSPGFTIKSLKQKSKFTSNDRFIVTYLFSYFRFTLSEWLVFIFPSTILFISFFSFLETFTRRISSIHGGIL